jgi:endoglucanase
MNPSGQWAQMSLSTARLMKEASPKGIAPNWVAYRFNAYTKTGQFFIKPERGDLGSYDAIRVYLWAGVTNIQDGLRKDLLNSLWGLEPLIKSLGYPPEEVIVTQGTGDRISPYGFSAAVVPFLEAIGKADLAQVQRARAKSMQSEALKKSKSKESPVLFYYDNILSLFGAGFDEKKYKFTKDGALELPWNQKSCELR